MSLKSPTVKPKIIYNGIIGVKMVNKIKRIKLNMQGIFNKIFAIYKIVKKYGLSVSKDTGKSLIIQFIEIVFFVFRGYHEEEYYILNLYNGNKERYLSTRQFHKIIEILNPPNKRGLVDSNKYIFSQYLLNHNISTPKCLGVLHEQFGFTHSLNSLKNIHDLKKLLEHIEMPIVFKPAGNTHGGVGVFIAKEYDSQSGLIKINGHKIPLEILYEKLQVSLPAGVLLQEKVEQHPAVEKVHPYSTNCARVYSATDSKGNIKIFGAVMKFGSKGSVVDNSIASGGVFANINIENGILGPAYNFFDSDSKIYHPYTSEKIQGIRLPHWDDTMELVKKAHTILAFRCGTFGWDIAFGKEEPIIIEANSKWYHNHFQKVNQQSLSNTDLKEIVEDRIENDI